MLTFLLAVIVIVGCTWLAVVARWFRWVLAALAALVLAVVLYFVNDHYSRKREEEASKHRIPAEQVQFEDMSLHEFQESSRITGRVRNGSPSYALTGAELEVAVQDCVVDLSAGMVDSSGDDIASEWKSFDEAKRDRLLKKMSPEQKKKLRAALEGKRSGHGASSSWEPAPNGEQQSGQKCETVGQTTVTSWSMNIPPMQSRAYDESVFFSSLPAAKGTYRWNYRVVYVKGAEQR